LKLLVDAEDWPFLGKTKLIFYIFCPPLSKKRSRAIHPLPTCPCGHTITFKKSEDFCAKKCKRPHLKTPLVRTGQTSYPLTADVFYGRPLNWDNLSMPPGRKPWVCNNTHCSKLKPWFWAEI